MAINLTGISARALCRPVILSTLWSDSVRQFPQMGEWADANRPRQIARCDRLGDTAPTGGTRALTRPSLKQIARSTPGNGFVGQPAIAPRQSGRFGPTGKRAREL